LEAKCIKFYEFGSPGDVLKVVNKEIQRPSTGEVLVRMKIRPINPSDLIPITGAYSHRISLPIVPGYEGIGIVEEVGDSDSNEFIGKRVLPLRGEGTWQEFVKTSADFIVPIPDGIDDITAAQLYINPLTAWLTCTEVLRLKPDDVLVVNACGSSIGRIYAQLSKILGFRLIAVTRNNDHTEELIRLGAAYVINTAESTLFQTVMQLTNGVGASAAIDCVGGVSGSELAFCVRPNAVFLTIGLLSGIPVNWSELARKTKVSFKMFHLRHWNQQVSVRNWQDVFNHLKTLIIDKRLTLMNPHAHYKLVDVKEAIGVVDSSRKNTGKILLTD
jgi:NADPH:quinone reductase-like Zn-dependent oxidoreductase